MKVYKNREHAGMELAKKLRELINAPNVIVIGLPRGGVVVAFQIANKLRLPMDIIAPRKIPAPGNPEFAIGAIDEEGNGVFNEMLIGQLEIPNEYIIDMIEKEKEEAKRRLKKYRGNRPPLNLTGKSVIIVDDGIATGYTMKAAIESAKSKGAREVIITVPVASADTATELEEEVDAVLIDYIPPFFDAVGRFYEEFHQTTDQEVLDLMYKEAIK